jgi:uncharacterized membrane protein
VRLLQYLFFAALALIILSLLVHRFMVIFRHMARSAEALTVLFSAITLLAGGTYVFHEIEGWRPLDALYFCVISLTTVGYGDLTPKTDAGKVMAIVYILLGLGIIMALATMVAQAVMDEAKNRGDRVKSMLEHRHQDGE